MAKVINIETQNSKVIVKFKYNPDIIAEAKKSAAGDGIQLRNIGIFQLRKKRHLRSWQPNTI